MVTHVSYLGSDAAIARAEAETVFCVAEATARYNARLTRARSAAKLEPRPAQILAATIPATSEESDNTDAVRHALTDVTLQQNTEEANSRSNDDQSTVAETSMVRNLDTGEVIDVGTVEQIYRGGPASAFDWILRNGGAPDLSKPSSAGEQATSTSSTAKSTSYRGSVPPAARWWQSLLLSGETKRAAVADPSSDSEILCVRVLERVRSIKNRAALKHDPGKAADAFGEVIKGIQVFEALLKSVKPGKARQVLAKYLITAEVLCRDALEACERTCGDRSERSSEMRRQLATLLRAQGKAADAEQMESLDAEARRQAQIARHVEAGDHFEALRLGWDGDCSKTRAALERGADEKGARREARRWKQNASAAEC